MGGPGSGGRRVPRSREPEAPVAVQERSDAMIQIAASDALGAAIRAATTDPEILYSLAIRPSFDEPALIVAIGEAQEKVPIAKLSLIQSTNDIEEFVRGLIQRAAQKYAVKRDYSRLDILNAVHFALLSILKRASPDVEHVMTVAREALRREFALPEGALVAASTPGRMVFLNRVLEEAIVGLIAQPAAR
jgi:hypothetical protein